MLPKKIRKLLAAIPSFLLLLVRLVGDARVAASDKAILVAAIIYAISPLDLVPDFLPFVGQLDDLYFVALSIDRLIRNAGPDVVRDHWSGSEEVLESLCGRLDSLAAYLPGPVERSLAERVRDR